MSLELIRESIKVNQVIGEETTQTVFENDIIVPDVKPDAARILLIDGDVIVRNAEAAQDKVSINGAIGYKILYVSDDETQSIKSINAAANINYELDMPNVRSGMKCGVKCDIEHIDYSILNGRKINTKAIVKIAGKATNDIEQFIVNDFKGLDDIQVLRENININSYLGDNESSFTLRESMEVPAGKPAIRELLRNDIKITGKDYKITDNKVIAKGELNVSTLYIGDDETQSIQFMEHEIPFTQFIDLPGIDENGSCELNYRFTDSHFEPQEDNDGELRYINGEVTLNIAAIGYAKKALEVVADAYSPGARITLDKEPFRLEEIAAESKSQIILKDTVVIEGDNPEITEVFNVLCKPSISDLRILDNKVILEGVAEDSILYLSNNAEQPICSYNQEVLFNHGIDIKGIKPDMKCEVDLDVEHCNYSMVSSNEVEVRLVLGVTIKVINQYMLPMIVKAAELLLDEKRLAALPSMIIYFSQPGDTLWKIAKKYFKTVDDIKKVNKIPDNEVITPGQQILIPGRI